MKRIMSSSIGLFLCLSFLAGGCVVTQSDNVETSGMWAHFVIDHHPDDNVYAWAVLRVGGGGGTIIDLVGADRMECNGTRMVEYIEPITNFHWTRAKVTEDPAGMYDFTFIRADEEVTTPVYVPDIPFIENPLDGVTVFPEESLALMWDDSFPEDYVNIFLTGGCIQDQAELDVEDDGDFTLLPLEDQDPLNPADCALYLEIRRLLRGSVDPAFQGGLTEAKRMDGIGLFYEQL